MGRTRVKQIDKYVLRQLIGPFTFFFVIFAGIIWLNQALRIVDVVVSNGQSGTVFIELSLYLLPKVAETVVPIAAFAAAIYLTNRLYSESEQVVIMSVGRSPGLAVMPYLIFGCGCFCLLTVLTHFLTPVSLTAFQDRQHEFSKEFLTQFVVEGAFSTPQSGVTVFFGSANPEGNLNDVLINDRRDPDLYVTHTAATGQVVASNTVPKLILFEGTIQHYRPETLSLSTIQFDSLSYDLSQFAKEVTERHILVRELGTRELFWPTPGSLATSISRSSRTIEAHDRLVKSLLSIIVPVLGAIILISSGYNRSGFFARIAVGVLFMVGINSLRGLVQSSVTKDPDLWPILYTPVFIGSVTAFLLVRAGMADWKSGIAGVFYRRKVQP